MNADRAIRMILRMVMRYAGRRMNKGKGGNKGDSPVDTGRARQSMRLLRRIGRF